jgi:hypothetical protein
MAFPLKFRRSFIAALAAGVTAAALWHLTGHSPSNLVRLDPAVPYVIEFGRGSGLHGLDTVRVLQDGTVTLHRRSRTFDGKEAHLGVETATLKLPEGPLAEVVTAVEKNRLLSLDRAYHGKMADGTQWVFWVEQGGAERAVYCDNNFPAEIVRFAAALDKVLAENGLEGAAWQPVPDEDAGDHERELWASIGR